MAPSVDSEPNLGPHHVPPPLPRFGRPQRLSIHWLLSALDADGLLTEGARSHVERDARAAYAAVGRQRTPTLRFTPVTPDEVVAHVRLQAPDGRLLDEGRIAESMARATSLAYENIDPLRLDMGLIAGTLSRPFALRHAILPLHEDGDVLVVAVANPLDRETLDSLSRAVQRPVRAVVAKKSDILRHVEAMHGFHRSVANAAGEAPAEVLHDFEQLTNLRHPGDMDATDAHIVQAVDLLLSYAFEQRASDVHIEPRRDESQVRLRIDGVLHDVHRMPRRAHAAFVSRIKTMARMDIAERRRPQDGRIKTQRGTAKVELRVSSLPTAFGEKIVVRVFDPEVVLRDLSGLGMLDDDLALYETLLHQPHGLVLVTGPTGSGKTTTLYATLKTLCDKTINITSIEDPIEIATGWFNQVNVQPRLNLDFAQALRAILRQDPDIIMVGEIRDSATAQMAVQAALTGHLVFSTLHTHSAAGCIIRMRDLDVPLYATRAAMLGVMAQRLVRRVCPACRQMQTLPEASAKLLFGGAPPSHLARQAIGKGCGHCRNTGFSGRIGLFEVLSSKQHLADAWQEPLSAEVLQDAAWRAGARSLYDCAWAHIAAGRTSVQEVLRVLGPKNQTSP